MKYLIFSILMSGSVMAQDIIIGNENIFKYPVGTKKIDVGFQKVDRVNTHTVKQTKHLLLRWKFNKYQRSVKGFYLERCVPRDDRSIVFTGYKEDIGLVSEYLYRVNYFPYAFRISAYGRDGKIIKRSQVRYIKQKK